MLTSLTFRATNKHGVESSQYTTNNEGVPPKKWIFRKLFCVPSLIWMVAFLVCTLAILLVLVIYRPNEQTNEVHQDFLGLVYTFVAITGYYVIYVNNIDQVLYKYKCLL